MSRCMTIVTDGSFAHSEGLAGFAFAIKNDPVDDYQSLDLMHGFATDVGSSDVAEWEAIVAALMEAVKRIEAGDNYDTIALYTDNQSVIDKLTEPNANTLNLQQYHEIVKMVGGLARNNVDFTINKVRAHVPSHQANEIETIHNRVDKAAVVARSQAQEHLFRPKVGSFVSVILPKKQQDLTDREWASLGRRLVQDGQSVRVAREDGAALDTTHPFLNGVRDAAESEGKPFEDVCTVIGWRPDNIPSYQGLDMALLRRYRYMDDRALQGGTLPVTQTFACAGAYSQLIYGEHITERLNYNFLTGRKDAASKLVMDFSSSADRFSAKTIAEWGKRLGGLVSIPHEERPERLLDYMTGRASLSDLGERRILTGLKRERRDYAHRQIQLSENGNGESPAVGAGAWYEENIRHSADKKPVRRSPVSRGKRVEPVAGEQKKPVKGFISGSLAARANGKAVTAAPKKMTSEPVRVSENAGSAVRMNVAKHNVSTQLAELFKTYGRYLEPQQLMPKAQAVIRQNGIALMPAVQSMLDKMCKQKKPNALSINIAVKQAEMTFCEQKTPDNKPLPEQDDTIKVERESPSVRPGKP